MVLSKKEFEFFKNLAISPSKEVILGKGHFGTVLRYNEKTAIKIFKFNSTIDENNNGAIKHLFNNLQAIKFNNLIVPKELIFYQNYCIGYLMNYVEGLNLYDIFQNDKVIYYQKLSDYLIRIDQIMRDEVLKNSIFYNDLKLDNTMIGDDIYLLDFDNSFIEKNEKIIISEYNTRIIFSFINCIYKNDEDYEMLKLIHSEAIKSSKIDKRLADAFSNPFNLSDYWRNHLITENIDQVDEFVKKYAKKIDGFKK